MLHKGWRMLLISSALLHMELIQGDSEILVTRPFYKPTNSDRLWVGPRYPYCFYGSLGITVYSRD